jgi:general secretion pathway protein C
MMVNDHDKGLNQQQGAVSALVLGQLVIASLCVVWIAHSSLHLFNILVPASENTQEIVAPTAAPSQSTLPTIDIQALRSLPLFGEYVKAEEPVVVEEPEEEALVETQLNLTLKGLFSSDADGIGRAIIANGREELLYREGDNIEGLSNVSLRAVMTDRVQLNNRGSVEVLYLYPEGERIASSQFSTRNESYVPLNDEDSVSVEPSVETKKNNFVKRNIKKLNEIIRVVRERDKTTGNMLGFRVLPGRDREGFAKSGLEINDVITSIDGEQLTDLRTAMSIYRNKRDATRVSLILRREAKEISLDIDLTELAI